VKRNAIKTTQKKRKHENATGSANGFNSANSIGETNCKRRKKGELTKNSKDPTAERKRKLIGEKKWHEKLDQAISFHKKHGHWRIKPHQSKHSKNSSIGLISRNLFTKQERLGLTDWKN